ncbi:hypothetical protein EVA_21766, partial [gut metagenome]
VTFATPGNEGSGILKNSIYK